MRKLLIIFIYLMAISFCVYADDVVADSCSRAHIQAAISAANTGDTIVIPAGDCTFDSPYIVSVYSKVLSFRGAGSGNTILRNTSTITFHAMFELWIENPAPGDVDDVEISGIRFIGEGSETYLDSALWMGRGPRDFKIHDCIFEDFGEAGIMIDGRELPGYSSIRIPSGVIYNCTFTDNFRAGYGYGVQIVGDNQWETPLTLGTSLAVFIEDCTFSGNKHAVTSEMNSKVVFRYNVLTDPNAASLAYTDCHGNPGGGVRGSRSYEFYENTISHSSGYSYPAIRIRGGDGVIFNNTMTNFDATVIYFANEVCANNGGSGYPKDDQTRDAYIWGNTNDAVPVDAVPSPCTENGGEIILEDRDIFNEEKGGYEPYTYPHPLQGESSPTVRIRNILRIRNVLRIK